jgi:hypothetical protein
MSILGLKYRWFAFTSTMILLLVVGLLSTAIRKSYAGHMTLTIERLFMFQFHLVFLWLFFWIQFGYIYQRVVLDTRSSSIMALVYSLISSLGLVSFALSVFAPAGNSWSMLVITALLCWSFTISLVPFLRKTGFCTHFAFAPILNQFCTTCSDYGFYNIHFKLPTTTVIKEWRWYQKVIIDKSRG